MHLRNAVYLRLDKTDHLCIHTCVYLWTELSFFAVKGNYKTEHYVTTMEYAVWTYILEGLNVFQPLKIMLLFFQDSQQM